MCTVENICWRKAYTEYLKTHKETANTTAPERLVLVLEQFIDPSAYPYGGIFAKNFPVWENGFLKNACPNSNLCEEYILFNKKFANKSNGGRHNLRKVIPKEIRCRVAERCRYKCAYCGVPIGKINPNTGRKIGGAIDHILPISKGGTDDESNLTLACRECNTKKGDNEWLVPKKQ